MAALTTPLVSVEEYIARFIESGEKPACEYVDGVLIPKHMAGKDHSIVQSNLLFYIRLNFKGPFRPLPELTTRVKETKFFVPDLAVEDLAHPIEGQYPGPGSPVFLCVEIKSPDDRLTKLFAKCDEYHSWGVPFCWIIEPDRRLAWEYFPNDYEPRKVGESLSAGPIHIPLAAIFESL